MDQIIEFIRNTNWQMIIAMFAIGWYFTRDISEEMKEQGKRIDRLYQICVDLLREKKG